MTVLTDLAGAEPWKPVPLRRTGSGSVARVGLAGTRASLLAGDDLELQIHLGPGASLEIIDLAALVLHHARGGSAQIRTEIELETGATLIWLGEPVIAAAGCHTTRTTNSVLGEAARLLLGERIVLGRADEQPGAFNNHQRITQAGRVVLDERLDTGDLATVRSPIVAGSSARMLGALTLIGERAPDALDVTQLHLEGSVWRGAGASHTVTREMVTRAEAWHRALRHPATRAAQAR